jgi:copper chaperone NosL
MNSSFVKMKRLLVILGAVLTIAAPPLRAGEMKPVMPGREDKCPVCGMFVAKYPDFIAEIVFRDGSYAAFDGVKDLCKYYFNLGNYNPGKQQTHIDAIWVMDYYRLEFIDGRQAFYVAGSDVYGPMGRELIPFARKAEAEEFMKDHRGTSLLTFGDVDMSVIRGLE